MCVYVPSRKGHKATLHLVANAESSFLYTNIYIYYICTHCTIVSNVFNWLHIFLHAGCEALGSRPGPADAHCERAQGKLYEVVIIVLIRRSNVRAVLPHTATILANGNIETFTHTDTDTHT